VFKLILRFDVNFVSVFWAKGWKVAAAQNIALVMEVRVSREFCYPIGKGCNTDFHCENNISGPTFLLPNSALKMEAAMCSLKFQIMH
jgi:hypothetical protein